jgi:aminopeptidase N
LFLAIKTKAQLLENKESFSLDDSLRGAITPERAWWDLKFYHLKVAVKPEDKTISGTSLIRYKVLTAGKTLQIDLQFPLQIQQIIQDGQVLSFEKKGKNAYFVSLKKNQIVGKIEEIEVFYAGKPRAAKRAPWDGGFSWNKDKNGNYFIATSCQGLGSSVWWPCKDHMYDEPDSMAISINVPKAYTDVSNGVLRSVVENKDDTRTFNWFVSNPINNYGVNINIAKYEHFEEVYAGEKGNLAVNYYVLPENLDKAKEQFKQVPKMLKAFEHWFGPYPFYEDGFKMVEVPYLGMEHQSSVTYGNKYKNGYLGRDLSNSGWGLKWDFIIVHESGHEWFANNITYKDIADMWIHEGFTAYSETLFTEYYYGKKAGTDYVTGTRENIQNDRPIIGVYGVNKEGSGDMYYKGANMIHSIRQYAKSDEDFRQILRGMNKEFYHQTVDTKQIEAYLSQSLGKDLSKIFDQFLRDKRLPVLEYKLEKNKITYRWNNCIAGFEMPILVKVNDQNLNIEPTTTWKNTKIKKPKNLEIDINYFAKSVEVK